LIPLNHEMKAVQSQLATLMSTTVVNSRKKVASKTI
jgi:hypothetical protein